MRAVALLATLTVLVGCTPTPYQPQAYTGGFSEVWQSERSVEVTFNGNGFTKPDYAERYALLRAAELALERGYPAFRRAEAETEIQETRSGSILTGGVRTTRKPGVEIIAVMLTADQAAALETQGVPIVSARLFIEQNAPDDVRRRILGEQ